MDPESQCMMCNRPDNADNLVQCDKCDGYVHFSCAEVGESIADADRSFTCRRCVESEEAISVSSHRSSRRSRTTSSSVLSELRLKLRLQQLDADRQNRLKELEDAERFQRLRRQVEADFEKQRFEALEAQLIEDDEHRSVRSTVSSRIIRENTGRWIGTSRTEGQVASTSTTTVTTTTLTDADRNQSGSAMTTPVGNVVVEAVATTQPEEPKFISTNEIMLQRKELNIGPSRIQGPMQTMASNVVKQQQEVVPDPARSRADVSVTAPIPVTVNVSESDRIRAETTIINEVGTSGQMQRETQPAVGTQLEPVAPSSNGPMYRVTHMGKTSVYYGKSTSTGQSTVSQVRNTRSKSQSELQPIVEVVQTSTPRQSLVVPMPEHTNQLGIMSKVDNNQAKSACSQNISQGQFSHPFLPQKTPYNGDPPIGSHTPVSMLPTESIHQIKPKSMLLPPSEHEQSVVTNPSGLLPPSGHKQVIESNPSVMAQVPKPHSSMSLPPRGERQNSVPNLPLSMQQVCRGKRTQWDQSMIQPSGYESFMRKPSMPPMCSTHLVGQSQQFVPNTWPSVPLETIPGSQQQQGTNLYRHPQPSEVSRGFEREQLTGLNQQAESETPLVAPQSGNRYQEEYLLNSEQPRFSASNSTLLLPTSGHQQLQLPSSSVFVPPSGQQQFQVPSPSGLVPPSGYKQVHATNPLTSELKNWALEG